MRDDAAHAAVVDRWLAARAGALSSLQLCDLFEAAFAAIGDRTGTILGEVTLGAIADRVLHVAGEAHPCFRGVVALDGARLDAETLRSVARTMPEAELRAGIRFVLVELLIVIGNLTAELLTPELHDAVTTTTMPAAAPGAPGRRKGEGRS